MSELDAVRAFLDPRHEELAEEAAAFTARELAALEEPDDDAAARTRARALLESMGKAGLYAPIRDRDLRGGCVIREALGRASPLADAVWALQGLGTLPMLLAENEHPRERWAEDAMAGRAMAAFAMTEEEAGSDVASMRTRAVRDGDGYVLDGEKTFISNAGIADFYTVFATTDPDAGSRGISCFVVPAEADGLVFLEAQELSAPHPLGRVALRECRVPASARLGEEGEGFKLGMATLDRLRPTVAAAACGMARRALDEAMDHASTREQFGRPLSEFQLIKEKLGRMATQLTASRLLVYRAAWEGDSGKERISTEAAMAKAFATEAAQEIVDEAVQILGGRGVIKSHPVDRLYRSVRALRIYEGTTEIQRLIVADRLLDERKRAVSEASGAKAANRDGSTRERAGKGEG